MREKTLDIVDLCDYATMGLLADSSLINVRITGPSGVIHINAEYVAGTWVGTPDIIRAESDSLSGVDLPLDSNDQVANGAYAVGWKMTQGDGTLYEAEKIYTLNYVQLYPKITLESNVRLSTLTATDATDYTVNEGEILISSVEHTITAPVSSNVPQSVLTGAVVTVGPNIWTREWSDSMLSTVVYLLSSWATGEALATAIDSASAENSITVYSTDLGERYYFGFKAINDRMIAARLSQGKAVADLLKEQRDDLSAYWNYFEMCERGGRDSGYAICKIEEIINYNGIVLTESEESVEIIPWGNIISGTPGSGTQWFSGAGAPSSLQGTDGDFYIDTLTGDLYKKITEWFIIMNLMGPQGPQGPAGSNGNDGDVGPAGPGAMLLMSETNPITLICTPNGAVVSYTGADTILRLFYGSQEIDISATALTTVLTSCIVSQGAEAGGLGRVVSITNLSASIGKAVMSISYLGQSRSVVITAVKQIPAEQGEPGANGTDSMVPGPQGVKGDTVTGPTGPQGPAGPAGAIGPRITPITGGGDPNGGITPAYLFQPYLDLTTTDPPEAYVATKMSITGWVKIGAVTPA